MALAVRIFGLSSWSVLVPEVLMGVGTVAVVYAAVRRRFSPAAGLIAGTVLALTPVAALMFRFNNPDALLALLMSVACYLVVRALEDGRSKWLVWAGVAIGFAFLAKTLQAFLILPALALVYGVCAPVRLRKRLGQLALATAAIVVSGGWWVAVVELWPASSRPYIGGSQNNSFLELTFGYNGLGRLSGEETGSVGGGGGGMGGGGGGQWGETGWDRMFNSEIGGQISWLLPAALILLVAGLIATRRAGRTDTARASFLVWGGSLLMTAAVFSYMAGIFHQYYTVALAPYLAAVTGMGAATLWERRERPWASIALAAAVTASAAWGYVLLNRTPDYLPWLKVPVLVGGLVAALGLVFAGRLGRRTALAAAGLGLVASLAAPTAYTLSTVREGHSGSIVTAGPSGAGMGAAPAVAVAPGAAASRAAGTPWSGPRSGPGTGPGRSRGRRLPRRRHRAGCRRHQPERSDAQRPERRSGRRSVRRGRPNGRGPGRRHGRPAQRRRSRLRGEEAAGDRRRRYTWAAAAIGSQNAASYQLGTGAPVMAIGGFNGTDPSPTLAQFEKYVADGRIHYFIGGGTGGDSGTASQISSWVEANFKEVTVGSATFYDLTSPTD